MKKIKFDDFVKLNRGFDHYQDSQIAEEGPYPVFWVASKDQGIS